MASNSLKPQKIILLLGVVFCFSVFLSPAISADKSSLRKKLSLPEFRLEAEEVSGRVKIKTDTGWEKLKAGRKIQEGARISTESGGTAALAVPGVSYLQMDTATNLEVNKLKQVAREQGLLISGEKVLENKVKLKLKQGGVQNSLRKHKKVTTEFDLETPNAVAGVRGTSYRCEVDETGRTTCGVLEGEVRFASLRQPQNTRTLRENEKSSLAAEDTEPEEPEQMSEKETEELQKFTDKAEKKLRLKPFADELQLNDREFTRTGKGIFKLTYEYRKQHELILSGIAGAREENAELELVEVNLAGSDLPVEGTQKWQAAFTIEAPTEGKKKTISGQVRAQDSLGQRSRAYPVQIILVHPEKQGALPANLLPGKVPINVETIGGRPVSQLSFPYPVSSKIFDNYSWQKTSDTEVQASRQGIKISGAVNTDSTVAGVAYRLSPAQEWRLAAGKSEWSFIIGKEELTATPELNPEVVAWTESGRIGTEVSAGQLNYRQIETVYPGGYSQGKIELELETINEAPVTSFPVTVKTSQLRTNQLVFRGRAQADSEIQGVAYRTEGGQWQQAEGASDWLIKLPLPTSSQSLELEIIAWTAGKKISAPRRFGPVEYQFEETVLPVNFTRGEVPVNFETLAGKQVSDLEFPFNLNSTQLDGDEIQLTGSVTADSPIKGVAVRVNGGNWQQIAEGSKQWAFTLPGTESGEFTVEVRAWTSGQVLGEIHSLGPVNFQVVETIPPSTYESGKVKIEFTRVAGLDYSNVEFPLHTFQEDLDAGQLIIEGTAEGEATIEGVAYSTDGGANWELAEGDANWSFSLPVEGSAEFDQLRVIAWTTAGIIGEAETLETIDHTQVSYSTHLRDLFQQEWEAFTSENTEEMLESYGSNFSYQDARTGVQKERAEFKNFLETFYSDVRNLAVSYNVNQVFSSQNGGEITFNLEWRGTADDPNRPFVIFGDGCVHNYTRKNDGSFQLTTFKNFPLILYLFHKEDVEIPDLGGIGIRNLAVFSRTEDADILAYCRPDMLQANYATLELGGDVKDGGLKKLSSSGFSGVSSLPTLGSGYTSGSSTVIHPGELYAINLRHQGGGASSALAKIIEITASHVEVQIISAQSPPGIEEKIQLDYRGVDPF